jgi:hypothetical protein
MAKKQTFGDKAKKGQKLQKEEHNFFGTRTDMVVKEIKEGETVVKIIAKDDKGLYLTESKYIGTGIADPNRYAKKREKLTEYEEELKQTEEK